MAKMAKMSRKALRQMILEQAVGAGAPGEGAPEIDTDAYMRLQLSGDPMVKLVGILMEELYHGNASRSPDSVRRVLSQIEDML